MPGQDWSCQEGGQEKGQEEHCRAHGLELPAALPDGCPGKRMGWENCSQPSPGATGWFSIPPAPSWFYQDVPREVAGLGWRTQSMVPVRTVHPIPVTISGMDGDGWGWQTLLCLAFRRSRAISVRHRGCCGEAAARETPPAPLACPIAQPEAPGLFFALLPCPQFPSPPSTTWSYLSDANFSFSISSQGPSRRASPPAWLPG